METTNRRREKKKKEGIIREVCTQSDWSLRLSRPGFGALLLLFLVVVNETWVNYSLICETIPFFYTPVPKDRSSDNDGTPYSPNAARLTPSEWRRSHQACLRAICRIADKIEFDCQVDDAGDSAHMMVIDDPVSHPITFDSEIPFPFDCHHTLELMLGSDTLESLSDYLRSNDMFQAETIDFIHLYENHLQPTSTTNADDETTTSGGSDEQKSSKKALFQILPGQCAIWEILQQSWYEWHGDAEGDPPPPIPLVDFDGKQPGDVVRIRAREYLCYEEYIPKEDFNSWISAYETVLEYRWYPSFVAAFFASTAMELLGLFAAMMRFLPLAICFWKYAEMDPVDPGGYKMLRAMIAIWRIVMHLIGIHAMAAAIAGSGQVYIVCILSTTSMLMYGNTKASMEWIFLHILSYGMEFLEVDFALNGQPNYNLVLQSIDEMMDIFIPAPGLCFKAIVVYILYMSSSRLLNTV